MFKQCGVVMQLYKYAPAELTKREKSVRLDGWTEWPLATWLFVLSFMSYVCVGFACALFPPTPRAFAGNREIPSDSTCLRVTRHADYITADLGVGTPTKQISLLLRLDRVLSKNDLEPAMRLFAQDTVESATISCEKDGQCQDVVVVQTGPAGEQVRKVARFNYRHVSLERSSASRLAGVGGELTLRRGTSYWISSTHVCYADAPLTTPSDGMVAVSVQDDFLVTDSMSLRSSTETRTSPVADTSCSLGDVNLFPVEAGLETSWLSILDTALYNSEPESVNVRRQIAELGVPCANNSAALERDMVLYHLDCNPYSTCKSTPSLPMRRVATSSIAINVDVNGNVGLWTEYDPTLSGLPRLANSTDAFALSIVKLFMIVLAAAVVYVRAKRSTASSSWLFKRCIDSTASSNEDVAKQDVSFSTSEDRLIGALAFTSRAVMILYRFRSLYVDDQARVCVSEIVATALSILHWILRYFCISADGEPPVSRMGGSTAVVDSTCAVMLAFAEAPILVVSIGKFDPTARLLTGLLISLIATTRCAFSASCCGVLWKSETNRVYKGVLIYSGIMWALQSVALGIIIVDLLVTPASYSMSRNVVGTVLPARILLLFTLVCVGLPRLMSTLRHILSGKNHVD